MTHSSSGRPHSSVDETPTRITASRVIASCPLAGATEVGLQSRCAGPGTVRRQMFVLLLTYVRPLEDVDALMRDHMAWLEQQYAAGRFIVSGRRVPRTGGVIVA